VLFSQSTCPLFSSFVIFVYYRPCSHIPTFSARHPMIPKLYVMPWKQDMKNQRLLKKAGIPVVPQEESLCLCGRERLCHSQDSTSPSSAPLSQTALMAHRSSHFSR
uniref:Testis expressed 43 n=1 Tax=Anabas testudineus TaxID=64144 RepID=A0A7N6BKV7_ANATE